MEQFKEAQVIMLPTKNKVNGVIVKKIISDKLQQVYKNDCQHEDFIPQHLYIISDDEIKEGDWFIGDLVSLKQCTLNNAGNINFKGGWYSGSTNCKKIIATTDTSLIIPYMTNYGTQRKVNDILQNKSLPQPSQQFVEKYIESYNKDEVITDVLVEYEIYMQRQSNIGTTKYIVSKDNKSYDKLNFDRIPTLLGIKVNPKDNTITIKKLKDSWNREEIIKLLNKLNNTLNIGTKLTLEQWINKNL